MVKACTTFGVPEEVLLDQGTEFRSELSKLLINECQTIQLNASGVSSECMDSNEESSNVVSPVEILHTDEYMEVRVDGSLQVVESVLEDLNGVVEAHTAFVVAPLSDCSNALVSLDSVMTTVVIATTSVLSVSSCTSSDVELVYMQVDFGENVILVRKMVLGTKVVHVDDRSNEVVVNDMLMHVVAILPCTKMFKDVHDDLLNDRGSFKGEWMIVYDDDTVGTVSRAYEYFGGLRKSEKEILKEGKYCNGP